MSAYYNEIDPFAASWLRELIKAGHIAPGEVDERSIEDVVPGDLAGFTQCHFFAGIGVWSYALRRAGWPDDRPVWTGSCPCQPFSTAGKGKGFADERHLWPAFFHLISQRKPVTVFGEQVASKDGLAWLDLVQADLEGEDYSIGAVDTCAAGFGAPHIRQRLYWVAYPNNAGIMRKPGERPGKSGKAQGEGTRIGTILKLGTAALLTGWITPAARDWKDTPGMAIVSPKGKNLLNMLPRQAAITGWKTPVASDGVGGVKEIKQGSSSHYKLRDVCQLASSQGKILIRLTHSGTLVTGSSAEMENGALLNPALSRWLMGLPSEWDDCAVMATPLSRRKRKRS